MLHSSSCSGAFDVASSAFVMAHVARGLHHEAFQTVYPSSFIVTYAAGSDTNIAFCVVFQLKDRNGSRYVIACRHQPPPHRRTNQSQHSRVKLKKYVKANNTITVASDAVFDAQFNKALRAGVEKGVFEQPKGE